MIFGGEKKRVAEMIGAAGSGDTVKIEQLLAKGADIDAPEPESGATPIIEAIGSSQWATVEFLLKHKPNLSRQDKNGTTPLFLAVSKGDAALPIVNMLLDAGAEPDLGPSHGSNAGVTPLHIAAATGTNGCLESLLRHGASPTKLLPDEATSMHVAVIGGDEKTIDLLFKAGVDVNALSDEKRTPLHNCAIAGKADLASALIRLGADVNLADKAGCSPLMHAVSENKVDVVKVLLDHGANPDVIVRTESSTLYPLLVAAIGGFDDILAVLIEKGANVAAKVDGAPPLIDAAKHAGRESTVKILTAGIKRQRAKAKAEKGPEKEITLIWKKIVQAVAQQDIDALRKLTVSKNFGALPPVSQALAWVVLGEPKQLQVQIAAGANLNKSFDDVLDGISLLYAAVGLSRNLDVVKCLLNAGANPNLTWENEATPIFEAVTDEQQEILKLLIDKGADVNAKMSNGQATLIMASANNSRCCVDMLLDAGADIDQAMTGGGLNAFSAAVDRLHMDLALHLLERGAKPDFGLAETLGLAVAEYGSLELIQTIEAKGGSIIHPDQLCRVAFVGSRNKDCEVLDHLFRHGANLSQDNDWKYTPLILSVLRNHPKLVQRYLERGDDPSIRDVDKETALSLAIENQRADMVSMLRKFNAEVGDYSGLSAQAAMLKAAQDGNLGTILNLHDAGVSLNVEDSDGNSPMLLATKAGHLGVVRSLYHLGADINHRNHAGLSATKIAASMQDQNLRTTMMEFVAEEAVSEGMKGIPLGGIHDLGNMMMGRLTHPGKENPPYDNSSSDEDEYEDDENDGNENEEPDEDASRSSDIDEEETLEKLTQLETLLGESHIASKFDDSMLERIAGDIEGIRTNGSSEYQPQIRGLLNLLESLVELEAEEPLPLLFEAIAKGNLRSLKQLLKDGSNVNSLLPDGTSALISAVQNGHVTFVTELLKQGADVNHRRVDDVSAVLMACLAGHENIVKLLVNSGADVNGTYTLNSENGAIGNNTALTVVAQRGSLAMCKVLVSLGADVNVVTDVGYTPLIAALANDCNEENAKYLLKAGANPDPDAVSKLSFSPSTTPLVLAATNGLIGVVKDLIKLKVSLDKQDGVGRNALKQAAMSGHTNVVDALLKAGAAVDIADHEGWTALTNAAGSRKVLLVKILLKAGANVNATSESGETPLGQAVASQARGGAINGLLELKRMLGQGDGSDEDEALDFSGSMEIIELLLKHGANPNVSSDGVLLLEIAKKDQELVKLLKKHGATESDFQEGGEKAADDEPDSETEVEETFLATAIRADVKELGDLVRAGVDVNYTSAQGQTALVLLLACLQNASSTRLLRRNAEQCIDFLLCHGANPNIGEPSPFVLAAMGRRLHLVQAMLAAGADINKSIGEGQTALFMSLLAPDAGQPVDDRCAVALLKAGADSTLRHESGASPIHLAAASNYIGALQELLERRPQDVDAQTNIGITPLMMAATEGHSAAVALLLKFGADQMLKDDDGLTAKEVAIKNGNDDLIPLFGCCL